MTTDYSTPLKDPRREKFCQLLYESVLPIDAYEKAGYKRNRSNCYRLEQNREIQGRLQFLQGLAVARSHMAVDDIVKDLDEARNLAKAKSNPAAMVAASMGTAKLLGLIIDRRVDVQKNLADMTEAELIAMRDAYLAAKKRDD